MEPIPLFTDTGCRTGHYAALRQAPLPFVFQSDQDYSGRDAPWRRCCCGGGEPWDCARRSGPGDYWHRSARGPATLSKPGVGRARTGDCGPEAVDAFGALGGECARRVPENGDRGVALPSPCPATTGTVDPGAGCTFEARMGRAPTCNEGPEADDAFEALGSASAEGPEILWPKGAPLSPSRRSTVTTWSSERSGGGVGRLAVACTTGIKLTLSDGFGAVAGGRLLWLDLSSRPPSYIYLGKCLAGCCYLSFFAPVGTSSTWLNPFISEVGPVNPFQNLGKFRATWS